MCVGAANSTAFQQGRARAARRRRPGSDDRYTAATMADPSARVVPHLPKPRGAYPHFRRAGDFIFVSGIGARRADNTIAGATSDAMGTTVLDIRAQTRAALDNVRAVLDAAGATLADVVDIVAFLVDMADFGSYNEVYAEYFGADGPARTTLAVHQLPHPHMRIEVKAVAWKPAGGES